MNLSCVSDLVMPYVEKLVDKVIEEAYHVFCFTCIVKQFEKERETLKPLKTTMEQLVEAANGRDNDINIIAEVTSWQENVDELLQLDTKTKQTCFFEFCPNCIWRYKTGKEFVDNLKQIKELREEKKSFVIIETPRRLPGIERYSSQSYISFKSRESKYKEMLDALKDDKNYIIGLQGMGGTGKTTLVRELGKELKQSKQFSLVIDTTVSCTPNIKNIQDDIAGPLGLDNWKDCNESDRPKRLISRLTKGEKILLIVDDVWEQDPPFDFHLDQIGIPEKGKHNRCRVLVTSRSKQVLINMDCDKIIELDLLTDGEAWIMFERCAGISKSSPNNLIGIGRKILKECKRLPIAIAVIAINLKGQDQDHEWKKTLNSLRKIGPVRGVNNVKFGIYKCLKVSYEYMKDKNAKGLFLMCSLFREDEKIPIEVLTRLCIGTGVFEEDYGSYDHARTEVFAAINTLVKSCLLLQVDEEHVKMHDLVREVAQQIANSKIQCVNLSDEKQKLKVESEKNIEYLLCEGKNIDLFSLEFDGLKLETLIVHMDRDCYLIEVPDSFLHQVSNLRVWYFSGRFIQQRLSLPDSIQSLTNIRSILIDRVHLGNISILGELQTLESLDLVECYIDELPSKIIELKKFKLLNLESCAIRRNNPFVVIQKCLSLEELYFSCSFNAFCQEITLPLTLRRYHITDHYSVKKGSLSKCMSIRKDYFSEATYKYVTQTAELLQLGGNDKGWENLMPYIVSIGQGMNDLIELHLDYNSQLQCLIDTNNIDIDSQQVPNVFSNLVVLHLENMDTLEELCNGSISLGSMNNLKEISIKKCPRLQSLFTYFLKLGNLKTLTLTSCPKLVSVFGLSTSQSLQQLENVEISDCKILENIISYERGADDTIEEISVADDDNDNNNSCNTLFPELKVIMIEKCPRLQSLFTYSIKLCNLKTLTLTSCSKLLSVFDMSTSRSLRQLENLEISDCGILKNIISYERGVDDKIEEISVVDDGDNDNNNSCNTLFPKLKVIIIEKCPQLQSTLPFLNSGDLLLLETISIEWCDNLTYIFDQHQDVELVSLQNLKLDHLPKFIDIFPESSIFKPQTQSEVKPIKSNKFSWRRMCCSVNQPKDCSISMVPKIAQCFSRTISHIVCNIKVIKLVNVSNIKSVFELSIAPKMSLEALVIRDCHELELIIVDIGDGSGGSNVVFPKLKELYIANCKKLEYIFGHNNASDDHQNHINEVIHLHLPALEGLVFYDLPSLIGMCTKNYRTTLPSLTEVKLEYIKSFGDFTVPYSISITQKISTIKGLSRIMDHYPVLKTIKMRGYNVESIFCLNEVNKQKMNLDLEHIVLRTLPMMTCPFVGPKNSFGLNNLISLTILRCENLKVVFSTSIIRCLPQLLYIRIDGCKELKHMIEDDLENKNMSNSVSSKTFFPKLETLYVEKCNKLKCVFQVSMCKELPKLKGLVLKEVDELEDIFKRSGDDDQKVKIPNLKVVVFVNLPSLSYAQGIHFEAVKSRFVHNCQKLSLTSTTNPDCIESISTLNFCEDGHLCLNLEMLFEDLRPDTTRRFKKWLDVNEASGQGSTSSQEDYGDGSVNDDMKISSTMEKQFSKDDEIIVSKSRVSSIASQFPSKGFPYGIEAQVTSGHELTSSHKKGIESKIPGLEAKMKQTEKGKQEFIVNIHGLWIPSVENSEDLFNEPSTSQQCLIDQQHRLGNIDTTVKRSQEYVDGSVNDDMKVSSTMAKQFPKDDKIMVSKSRVFSVASQFPSKGFPYGTEAQATSGHELTSSHKNGIESKIPGLEAKMKQTTKGKQEFIVNIHGVWIPSVASSEDIKLSVEDITTLVPYAKTITSPTLSKPNISSSGPSVTYDHKTSSLEYGDAQIAIPYFSISTKKTLTIEDVVDLGDYQETTQTNNQVSLNDDAFMKGSSNVEEQFPMDDQIFVSKSRLFSTASQFLSMPSKGDASEIVEDLSSSLLVKRELEQLVFKKHLDYENLSLLTDFLVKHPSVLLRDTSLSNRYKGYAYNCLSEVLKFLQTHSVLDVLGSSHSEFVELLQDARRFPFDKDWLDGVEKRSLFPGLQVSQAALQKVLDSKHILTQHVEDLKHQLASSEAVLESIIQQEAQILETRAALSDPIGY